MKLPASHCLCLFLSFSLPHLLTHTVNAFLSLLALGMAVLPLSLIFVGMISFNNLCLQHVEVSFCKYAPFFIMILHVTSFSFYYYAIFDMFFTSYIFLCFCVFLSVTLIPKPSFSLPRVVVSLPSLLHFKIYFPSNSLHFFSYFFPLFL